APLPSHADPPERIRSARGGGGPPSRAPTRDEQVRHRRPALGRPRRHARGLLDVAPPDHAAREALVGGLIPGGRGREDDLDVARIPGSGGLLGPLPRAVARERARGEERDPGWILVPEHRGLHAAAGLRDLPARSGLRPGTERRHRGVLPQSAAAPPQRRAAPRGWIVAVTRS